MNNRIAFVLCGLALLSLALSAYSDSAKQANANNSPAQTAAPSSEIRFAFGGNAAEIPADFTGNVPFLPLRVGESRPSFFVLDSTASASSIDPDRAATLGVTAQQSGVLNLNGVGIRFASLPAIAKKDFSSQVGRIYEGTLGNDFFQRLIVEIDYGRHTVRLYDPGTYHYSGEGTILHLTFSNGVPIVQGKFAEPKGKVLEANFAVNTALDASVVISDRYAESHRVFRSHWKTISSLDPELDASQGVVLGRLKGFELGRYDVENAIATFSRANLSGLSDPKVAGEIGGGMLARFKVVFDYPHRQMIIEPDAHFADEEEEDKSGVSVVAEGKTLKTFEIVQVEPRTPGAEAGLQKGDVIAGIDNDAAADLTLADVRDLFRAVGHKYNLVVERDGQMRQVTIEMRRLLN